MAKWYILRDGNEQGPISPQRLKELATSGRLQPDDQVRREDQAGPVPAGKVAGLFVMKDRMEAPSPSSSKHRTPVGKSSKLAAIIISAAAASLLFSCMCCGGLSLIGHRMQLAEDAEGIGLSGGYLPYKAGVVKKYEGHLFDIRTGSSNTKILVEEVYHDGRRMTETMTMFAVDIPIPMKQTFERLRVRRNGFVDSGDLRIKVGASPGDQWPSADAKSTFRLISLDGGRAEIQVKSNLVDATYVKTYILDKRGLLEETHTLGIQGQEHVVTKKTLVQSH